MNKLEKLENITITYSKCLVLFLMCFIPFRNELELLLGTYIKVFARYDDFDFAYRLCDIPKG